jgi:hypothetical protein
MAAIVRASYASGAGPSLVSAETGAKYNREETLAGTTAPIPKPNAAGTAFSYPKSYRLEVTTLDAATSISNFRHRIQSAPSAGLKLWFRDDGATYQRPNALAAADSGSDDSTPSGYTTAPTSDTVYDAGSYAASSTGGKGDYLSYALGVSNLYLGGAGPAIALPNCVLTYDEA